MERLDAAASLGQAELLGPAHESPPWLADYRWG